MTSKKRVINKIIIYLALISLLQLIVLPAFISAESKYVEIIDIDTEGYSEKVSKGEDTYFDWTLENTDNFNRSLNISISIENSKLLAFD